MNGFRTATYEDLALLNSWTDQPYVREATGDADWNWEVELQKSPEWREYLVYLVDNKPIGFVQIIDPFLEETHYWGKVSANLRAIDIWIGEQEYLGMGIGTNMMREAMARCFKDPGVEAILIDPGVHNKKAIRFYERLGFEFVENRVLEEQECAVHQISRKKWSQLSS